jgi:TM2 domain-containing membrane protein YozV
MNRNRDSQKGASGWILLWLVGIPIPILLLLFVARGCT